MGLPRPDSTHKKDVNLKILVVIEKNSWIDTHISESLEEMGHHVYRFYYGDFISEFYGKKRRYEQIEKNKQLLLQAKNLLQSHELDLIFCYVYDDFLLPEYAHALAKLDVPLVNYNVDMACQWYRQIRTAKYFSCILCGQPDNIKNMTKYASKVLYFPMAGHKSLLMEDISSNFIPSAPVTFLGTPTDYRVQMLSMLATNSVPLSIYGKYWKIKKTAEMIRSAEKTIHDIWYYGFARLKGEGIASLYNALKRRLNKNTTTHSYVPNQIIQKFLPNNAIQSLFQQSKINLGFTRISGDDPYKKGGYQMRLRDFEVPLAGGFYLVEKAPGYEDFFALDKEVVTWSHPNELLEKISYYLEHEEERKSIAKAGKKRALAQHTWEHRFSMLFKELRIQ